MIVALQCSRSDQSVKEIAVHQNKVSLLKTLKSMFRISLREPHNIIISIGHSSFCEFLEIS